MVPALHGLAATLLVPLYARCRESLGRDPIIDDPKAVEIVQALDYEFGPIVADWASELGVALRTEVLDDETRAFLTRHPEAAILNLGCGLCTRHVRLDNGRALWVELDLPEVEPLWRHFFRETKRLCFVAASAYAPEWLQAATALTKGRPLLIIAEGLLMYFTAEDNRSLLTRLIQQFPGAELLLETFSPLLIGLGKWHPAACQFGVEFRWGVDSAKALERWSPHLRVIDEHFYLARHPERWGVFAWLQWNPLWRHMMRIIHLHVVSTTRPAQQTSHEPDDDSQDERINNST